MFAPMGFDNEKFKTELCVKFQELGSCPYNERCRFAHGEAELRQKPKPKQYKTKPCNNYMQTGKCPYGARCNFLHGPSEPVGGVPQNTGMRPMGGPGRMRSMMPQGHDSEAAPMTYHQRMRQRQQQGWENFMTGTKDISGCYNVKTVRGFHCERPPVSERFQAWKEMRGEGELPSHVLILQDNTQWIVEAEQKLKSEQLLLEQQQQFQQLSALLGGAKVTNLKDSGDRKRRKLNHRRHRRESDSETTSDDTEDDINGDSRKRRRRRGKRRGHRRRRTDDEEGDSERAKRDRSQSRSISRSGSRSRSRSRSRGKSGSKSPELSDRQNDGMEQQEAGNTIGGTPIVDEVPVTVTSIGNGDRERPRQRESGSDSEQEDKSPSLDDGDDAPSENRSENETLAEMPIPE